MKSKKLKRSSMKTVRRLLHAVGEVLAKAVPLRVFASFWKAVNLQVDVA